MRRVFVSPAGLIATVKRCAHDRDPPFTKARCSPIDVRLAGGRGPVLRVAVPSPQQPIAMSGPQLDRCLIVDVEPDPGVLSGILVLS